MENLVGKHDNIWLRMIQHYPVLDDTIARYHQIARRKIYAEGDL